MSTGTLASWNVAVGDTVAPGDTLAEVETDKATMAWENQDDGVVAALLAQAGARDIEVGTPLVVLVDEASDVAAFAGYEAPKKGGDASAAAPAAAAPAASAPVHGGVPARLVGPAAARVLREAGLTPADAAATGPRGALTKADALAAVARGGAAPKPAPVAAPKAAAAAKPKAPAPASPPAAGLPPPRDGAVFEDVPHTQIRRIIAARLTESKTTVPHAYYRGDADLGAVAALRAQLKARGVKASVNDFVIAAAARALLDVPELNATWDGDEAVRSPSIDVCVAVATDGGLITPIVTAAPSRSLSDLGDTVRDLATRGRAGKLAPHEYAGGSFTISNLGMYGVTHFAAIINPPQAAILAVGGPRAEAVDSGGDAPEFRTLAGLTLSVDARAVSGDAAAAWLDAFAAHLAEPETLLEGVGSG
jgi:pyruvate dehydrogenase complex dihydrolipoamide acetyltransferase long form